MEDLRQQEIPQKVLPFDNLHLNSGYVSGFNSWWMYLFTILITAACYFGAPSITFLYVLVRAGQNGISISEFSKNSNLLFDYKFIGVDKNTILIALLGIFVITALGFFISIKQIHKKTLTSILTGYEKFRFKRFWFGFAIWGSFLIIMVLTNYVLDPESLQIDFHLQGFLISILLMLVFMPIQTGFEEAFFRGYLVQGLSQLIKNGIVPVIITSLLFGAAHMSNPEVQKYGWPIMLTYYVFFALFMGCLTLLDEGLELAFGIHFANNFVSSVLINSPNSVLKTYSIFESKTENPYQEIVLWFCMAITTFFVFWWKYKWKNFKLIIR